MRGMYADDHNDRALPGRPPVFSASTLALEFLGTATHAPAKEFQCQGRCGKDWRSAWESASAKRRTPARLKDRTLALAQPQRPVQETIVGREHQSAISALAPDGKLPSEALTASSGRDTSIQRQALR